MAAEGRNAQFPAAWDELNRAVTGRQTKIAEEDRRTSALKVVDATEQEVMALFYELKRHALKHKNPNSILAVLFVLVAGHSGFRPIELRGASFDGTWLSLPNAKKCPGQEPQRRLNLSELHQDVKIGIDLLLSMIDHDLSKREFAKWQKCLAAQLQRACERIDIRTLSLYSFRHVSIASWSAAGLGPEEIARLCGHSSIRTAHAHYARAQVGHKRKAVARAELDEMSADAVVEVDRKVDARFGQVDKPDVGQVAPRYSFDDMPVPQPRKTEPSDALAAEEVRHRFERYLDPRPVEEIAASLRKKRQSPQSKPSPRKSGAPGDG